MQQISRTAKTLITFICFGYILWVGGNFFRTIIAYDLFEPFQNKIIERQISPEVKFYYVYNYTSISIYTDSGFAMVFVPAIALMILWRRRLKSHGWLFMSYILFFIASAVSFYNLFQDIHLVRAVFFEGIKDYSSFAVQEYFLKRFTVTPLTIVQALAFLSAVTIVVYIVWKPLTDKRQIENKPEDADEA